MTFFFSILYNPLIVGSGCYVECGLKHLNGPVLEATGLTGKEGLPVHIGNSYWWGRQTESNKQTKNKSEKDKNCEEKLQDKVWSDEAQATCVRSWTGRAL